MSTWYCPFTTTTAGMFTSTDDGATWAKIASSTIPGSGSAPYHGYRIYPDQTHLLIIGNVAYTSTNNGVSWTTRSSIGTGVNYTAQIAYLSDDIQLVVGTNSTPAVIVTYSTDHFVTVQNISLGNFNLEGLCRLTSGRFIVVAGANPSPVILYSDNGTSWIQAGTYPSGYTQVTNSAENTAFNAGNLITVAKNSGSNLTGILSGGSGTGTYAVLTTNGTHTAAQNPFFSRTVPETFGEPGSAVLVYQDSGPTPRCWTTTNGSTWTYHDSPTGIPAATIGGYAGIVRLHDTGTYLLTATNAGVTTLFRSTDGIAWVQATVGGGATSPINPSNPDSTMVNATPVEFPHFPDRGLPIEIAGPRNDLTKKAYLPNVRIFTA